MAQTRSSHCHVVAFEGSHDIVSTQLRLLPTSPQVITIPPLEHFLEDQPTPAADNIRAVILQIHNAAAKRAELVHTYLSDSNSGNKKVVFLHGGTAAAVAKCITAIRTHYVSSDIPEAEFIYHELVRNGVEGLKSSVKDSVKSFGDTSDLSGQSMHEKEPNKHNVDLLDDPISRAMKAADALDRETASLQPSTDLDLTIALRSRSQSVPILRISEDLENAAPFYVFGASETCRSFLPQVKQNVFASGAGLEVLPEDVSSQAASPPVTRPWRPIEKRSGPGEIESCSPKCVGEPYSSPASEHKEPLQTPATGASPQFPASSAILSADVMNARSSDAPHSYHRRVMSIDRIYATAARHQDVSLCPFSKTVATESGTNKQTYDKAFGTSIQSGERAILHSKYYSEISRDTSSKTTAANTNRNLPSPLRFPGSIRRSLSQNDKPIATPVAYANSGTETECTYVDRGADAIETHLVEEEQSLHSDEASSEVVLPMVEDLVIHFRSEKLDTLLDAMISGLQGGMYPVSIPPLSAENVEDAASSSSSTSIHESLTPTSDKGCYSMSDSTITTAVYPAETGDYDPFASHGDYLRQAESHWAIGRDVSKEAHIAVQMQSVAPSLTQAAQMSDSPTADKSFHDLQTADCHTAVGVQNALRMVLNIYFPPEGMGSEYFTFPSLPELNSLWKPVFRTGKSDSALSQSANVDLILAIGAQQGVEREFLGAISGSLEKLGSKANGITRSGRLDIRYLIASAMQTFTAQPLANQTTDNPLTNSLLLATMIIPFLELYMAAHTDTRFLLLEYPTEHLTTVLALQRLIGVDLIKIAGIINPEAGEPKPFAGFETQPPLKSRSQSMPCTPVTSTSAVGTHATLLAPGSPRTMEAPAFSKTNFLLTSSATESEIATLISTIWKLLVDISPFYIPEGTPKSHSARRASENKLSKRTSSDVPPRSSTPLIDSDAQYAPLASAAAIMGFVPAEKHNDEVSQSVASWAGHPQPTFLQSETGSLASSLFRAPASPMSSPKTSNAETIMGRTVRTMVGQGNKIRIMLGREPEAGDALPSRPGTMSGSFFDLSDDEDGRFAAEERKYIPLFGRSNIGRKGNSRKALRWLGLSAEQ